MAYFSDRLPHIVRREDLAILLAPIYAETTNVDDDEAKDRLLRALADEALLDDLYLSLSAALTARAGPRMDADALMDKLSKGIGARRSRVKSPPATPELFALLVRINLLIGEAAANMRNVLESEKGRAAMKKGLQDVGAHLVRELLK
jgi:hypothetical protein